MNDLSFNIETSEDFLKKLIEDHKEFKANQESSRIALNCAMTSWHLTEWIYNEYHHIFGVTFRNIGLYQNEIKNLCPSLQIMHDLANGSKHYSLTRHIPIVDQSNLHQGQFSNEFSREFDISYLYLILKNGTKVHFEDEIDIVVNFWKQYFEINLGIVI